MRMSQCFYPIGTTVIQVVQTEKSCPLGNRMSDYLCRHTFYGTASLRVKSRSTKRGTCPMSVHSLLGSRLWNEFSSTTTKNHDGLC